jgi:hypothetical protein
MKKSIPLQSPPDFNSIVPPDLAGGSGPPPPASTSGMDMDNLSPEEAGAIPNEGSATVKYKVHHRRSEQHINKDGKSRERHSIRMHVHDFEPHNDPDAVSGVVTPPAPPRKKKLTASTNAQDAVMDNFSAPDGTP